MAPVRAGETVGLICGEIDIRVHFAKQRQRGRTTGEIVNDTVSRYFEAIEVFQRDTLAPIAVFSVTPPAAISYPSFDPIYPRNGSDEERVLWTYLLNARLKARAAARGYLFVDQHSAFADAEGLLGLALSPDGVHIEKRYANLVNLSDCLSREIDVSLTPSPANARAHTNGASAHTPASAS